MWQYAPLPQYMFNKRHNNLPVFDAIVASVTVLWQQHICVARTWAWYRVDRSVNLKNALLSLISILLAKQIRNFFTIPTSSPNMLKYLRRYEVFCYKLVPYLANAVTFWGKSCFCKPWRSVEICLTSTFV